MIKEIYRYTGIICLVFVVGGCNIPSLVNKTGIIPPPGKYDQATEADTVNIATIQWKEFFKDPYLVALIDTALKNNQELNITLQEIEISRNEIRARKGEYLPFVGVKAGAGAEKAPRYTNIGAMEATTEIEPGRKMPEPVPDYQLGLYATWELDIWRKLRNAKKAAVYRYLATVQGKNFLTTNLVAEVANSYYELIALDNQMNIVRKNIEIQNDALQIVKMQKQATRVTELAVRRFEAQVLNTQSLQFRIQQEITQTENRINYLLGRYPRPVSRSSVSLNDLLPQSLYSGIPSQLLANRPDILQAEQELVAAKLDVKVARAAFYPSLGITAGLGYRAFNPAYLFKSPESLLYSLAGDLAAPLINRNAIKATYYNANAKQLQTVYNYERTVINACMEVTNQLANVSNLGNSYKLKAQQVEALSASVDISNNLFRSARADYMEVLLTQRDALEAKFELIETQKQQMNAVVNIYRALGGGWK